MRRLIVRRVRGQSMQPTLPPGKIVMGWTNPRYVQPGAIVIFRHEGREKIKRVHALRDGEVFVVGDHADASTDSREFGWLKLDCILAQVWWPHRRFTGYTTEQ